MNTTSWNSYLAVTWDKYLPPIRPYAEELSILRRHMSGYIESTSHFPSVLILGSTPELRDLASELGLVPTVVDYSEDNYIAMGELKQTKRDEIFVRSNWLDFNPSERYDIILSEAAFNVVDSQSSVILYSKCKELLKPGGKLLAKNWVRISDRVYPANDLIWSYRHSTDNRFGFYSYVCIPLMLCFYDYENEKITLKDFSARCRNLFENGSIDSEEWSTIAIHAYENVDLQLYIPDIFQFISDIATYFQVDDIYNIKIAYSEYHPIFVLTRR